MCSLRPIVGSATLTLARSAIDMKYETASTANARQRWTWFPLRPGARAADAWDMRVSPLTTALG